MRQTEKTSISIALGALAAFALWTVAITRIDVQPIGPNGTAVGFASLNGAFHDLTGVHWLADIAGGVLLSLALVMLYRAATAAVGIRRPSREIEGSVAELPDRATAKRQGDPEAGNPAGTAATRSVFDRNRSRSLLSDRRRPHRCPGFANDDGFDCHRASGSRRLAATANIYSPLR